MQSLLSLLGAQKTAKEETASIDSLAAAEIKEKILDACLLPHHHEVMQLMQLPWYNWIKVIGIESWESFCNNNGIYQVHTVELVDGLAEEIKKLGNGLAVEVCAGDGKLSYHLRKRRINIRATDDYSWRNPRAKRSLVQNFSWNEALETYNPRIVLASWIPRDPYYIDPKRPEVPKDNNLIDAGILNFPSVKYFIHIQDDGVKTPKSDETAANLGFEAHRLHNVGRYGVCRRDSVGTKPYTEVVLVKKP